MTSAGWSNEGTFQHFYRKPTECKFNVGSAVLPLAGVVRNKFVFMNIAITRLLLNSVYKDAILLFYKNEVVQYLLS